MAATLSLVRTADFESADIESISLLGYTNGFLVENNSWSQVIASDDDESAIEAMTLFVKGTSHDNLAANLVALDKLLAKGKWYKETQERYGLWLRAQLTNETNARQALILKSQRGQISTMSKPASPGNLIKGYPLTLERMPLWEATAATTKSYTVSPPNSVGGIRTFSTAVVGTDSARIASLTLAGTSLAPTAEYWVGFRTSKNGVLANFTSPWELESGAAGTDTALEHDTTASPGGSGHTKLNCTFATATAMTSRVTLTPYQIDGTNYEDLRGTFDIILRAKCAANIATRVRLSLGLNATSYTYFDPVAISSTAWKLYHLGRITLPAGGKIPPAPAETPSVMRRSTIQLEAELTSGTTVADALGFDCLIPIPVDEGCAHFSGGTGAYTMVVLVSPSGIVSGYEYELGGNSLVQSMPGLDGVSSDTFTFPYGVVSMVMAAQRSTASVLTDTVSGSFKIIPRWRVLRGNE